MEQTHQTNRENHDNCWKEKNKTAIRLAKGLLEKIGSA